MMSRQAILAALLGAVLLPAQEVETTPDSTIQVEVNVVNVPVTVVDNDGNFVIDLGKEDFRVFEDGEPVQIRYLTSSEDKVNMPPLYVGFVVDKSSTARRYYKTYKKSIGDLAFALVPEGGKDRGFLLGYHSEVDLLVKMTEDPYYISEKLESLKHGGGSAMLDAIYEACTEHLASVKYKGPGEPRKVIVIIGDGHDSASKRSIDEVIDAAQRNQVTIYVMSTVAWGFHEAEAKNLDRLVKATGGHLVQPMDNMHKGVSGYLSKPQDAGNFVYTVGTGEYEQAKLQAIYDSIKDISGTIQKQYVLGYAPPTPFSDGKYRRIRVEVNFKADVDIEIRHRTGYFPPPPEAL